VTSRPKSFDHSGEGHSCVLFFLRIFFVVGIYSTCFQTAQHLQQKSVVAPSVSNSLPRQ